MSSDGSDDTEVMFEIGVTDHPETGARLNELAKQVLGTQETMRLGVERIGLSAKSISAALVPLRLEIQAFRTEAESLFADVQKQSLKAAGVAARPVRPQMPKSVQDLEDQQKRETVQPRKDAPGNLPIDDIDASIREMKLSFKPLGLQAKSFRDEASEMLRDVERAFEQVSTEAEKIKVRPTVPAKQHTDDPKEWAQSVFDSIFGKKPVAVPPVSAPPVSAPTSNPGKSPLSDIPTNIESVMRKLGDDLRAETDSIVATFDSKIAALPNSLADANSRIKAEFAKRVKDQASAFEKMASDLDNAVEKQRDSTVDINSAVAKGARAVNEMAQGFAHLGLLSAESSEQMLKGLIAVQGAVDLLDGSVDLLEAFSQGWKSVRKSVKAASDVQKAQQALSAAQLPQLRAYHTSLMAEASAANTAAAANVRLGAARKGASLGVGAVGKSAASGVAASAAGSAAGSMLPKVAGIGGAVAGGAGATTFAGVGIGLLGTVAAAGAALASVSLVAVELKEAFTGQAMAQKSVTKKIAEYESSIIAGGFRMTGMFERFDAPAVKFLQNIGSMGDSLVASIPGLERFKDQLNFTGGLLGDLAGLAASTAAVERASKSLDKNRVINDAGRAKESIQNEFADKSERQNFSLKNETAKFRLDYRPERARAEIDQEAARERLQLAQESQSRGDVSAVNRVTAELAKIMRSQASLNSIALRPANEQLSSERNLRSEAQRNLVSSTQRVEGIRNGSIVAEDSEAIKAGEQQLFWRDKVRNSIMAEMELIRQKRDIEIEGQKKVSELYGEQLSLKRQQLLLSIDAEEAAMLAFASLSNEDKGKAKAALQAGRMRPDLLQDEQKDLLRRVGTKESLTIAKKGDIAEAKKFGFSEQNFGRGFKTEQQQLKSEVQRLEAQVSSTYDVRVKLETDNRGLVSDLVTKTKALMAENNKAILETFSREMKASELTINNTMNDKLKQMQK